MCSVCGRIPCRAACPNATVYIAAICDVCNAAIFDGDTFYRIEDMAVCEDCIENARRTAEYSEPEYED